MNMYTSKCSNCISRGLLVLRVAVGAGLMYHGIAKLGANEQMINFVGGAAHKVGLTFLSTDVWFQIARAVEIGGGALLILGLFTQVAAFLGLLVLLFAANSKGRAIARAELDYAYIAMLLTLVMTGAGRFSLDALICKARCKNDKYGSAMKDGCCGGVCHDTTDVPVSKVVEEKVVVTTVETETL